MTPDERAARIHHHEYSGEGIREHAERIVALEELVMDLYDILDGAPSASYPDGSNVLTNLQLTILLARMTELGVIE